MAIFQADNNKVTMLFESGTYATPSGASGNWLGLVTNHEPSESTGVMEIRYTGTSDRNVGIFVDGPKDFEGTITYHPQDWTMLGFALGSIVDGGAPSPYTHVLSEANSDDGYAYTSGATCPFASFTVYDEHKGTDDGKHQIRKYQGCIIDSWSMSASEGEALECEVSYRAKDFVLGSKTTDILNIANQDTSRPYIWSDVSVQLPSGTTITSVKDVSFTVNNNLEEKHYIGPGSREVEVSVPLNRDYEVSITADSTSTEMDSYYNDYWQSGTTFNMMLQASQSTGSEEIFVIMSGCKMTEFSSPSPSEGIDEYSITIKPQTVSANVNDLVASYNPW